MANTENLKPFEKGDPRINRKGRPKTFDKLRALAISIASEDAGIKDREGNDTGMTNAEAALRSLMKTDTKLFFEIAFGKPPAQIEVVGKKSKPLEIRVKYVDQEKPVND